MFKLELLKNLNVGTALAPSEIFSRIMSIWDNGAGFNFPMYVYNIYEENFFPVDIKDGEEITEIYTCPIRKSNGEFTSTIFTNITKTGVKLARELAQVLGAHRNPFTRSQAVYGANAPYKSATDENTTTGTLDENGTASIYHNEVKFSPVNTPSSRLNDKSEQTHKTGVKTITRRGGEAMSEAEALAHDSVYNDPIQDLINDIGTIFINPYNAQNFIY